MIQFRQKEFTEYDAMKSLYNEILKSTRGDREKKFPVIDKSALISVLKGNNVVIEKFVISTSFFGKDVYRMYLKIGAKAKLPDDVRLPGKVYDENLLNMKVSVSGGLFAKDRGGDNGGKKGPPPFVKADMYPNQASIKRTVNNLLGEAIDYSKVSRTLVLEFPSIRDAIEALNILPFGLNYKIYLLDA